MKKYQEEIFEEVCGDKEGSSSWRGMQGFIVATDLSKFSIGELG